MIPADSRPGDTILLLGRCSYPVVLRAKDDNHAHFEFIGPCCIPSCVELTSIASPSQPSRIFPYVDPNRAETDSHRDGNFYVEFQRAARKHYSSQCRKAYDTIECPRNESIKCSSYKNYLAHVSLGL